MDCQLSWLVTNRVVLLTVTGEIDFLQLKQLVKELNSFLDSGEEAVYIITDAREMTDFPKNLPEVQGALSIMKPFQVDIIVGFSNPIAKFLANVISQLSKFEVRTVETLEEAIETLQRIDPSLNVQMP